MQGQVLKIWHPQERGLELYSTKSAFNPLSDNIGEALLPEEEPRKPEVRGKPAELKASRQFFPRVGKQYEPTSSAHRKL